MLRPRWQVSPLRCRSGGSLLKPLYLECSVSSGLLLASFPSVQAGTMGCHFCVKENVAGLTVIAGALADLAIGFAILTRPLSRYGLWAALIISLVYVVIGTTLVPRLWNDPLGPMLTIWQVANISGPVSRPKCSVASHQGGSRRHAGSRAASVMTLAHYRASEKEMVQPADGSRVGSCLG